MFFFQPLLSLCMWTSNALSPLSQNHQWEKTWIFLEEKDISDHFPRKNSPRDCFLKICRNRVKSARKSYFNSNGSLQSKFQWKAHNLKRIFPNFDFINVLHHTGFWGVYQIWGGLLHISIMAHRALQNLYIKSKVLRNWCLPKYEIPIARFHWKGTLFHQSYSERILYFTRKCSQRSVMNEIF